MCRRFRAGASHDEDLLATKVEVVLQRAESKDYRDIARMLTSGANLSHGLAAAVALFGDTFQPSESLRALVFFQDGDLASLGDSDKAILVNAAKAVASFPRLASCHGAWVPSGRESGAGPGWARSLAPSHEAWPRWRDDVIGPGSSLVGGVGGTEGRRSDA
jgi:hypothetical protein